MLPACYHRLFPRPRQLCDAYLKCCVTRFDFKVSPIVKYNHVFQRRFTIRFYYSTTTTRHEDSPVTYALECWTRGENRSIMGDVYDLLKKTFARARFMSCKITWEKPCCLYFSIQVGKFDGRSICLSHIKIIAHHTVPSLIKSNTFLIFSRHFCLLFAALYPATGEQSRGYRSSFSLLQHLPVAMMIIMNHTMIPTLR